MILNIYFFVKQRMRTRQLLMYALTAAYTAQGSSLLGVWLSEVNIITPFWLNSIIYLLILGGFVYTGAFAADA